LAHLEHAARALSEAALGGFPEDEVLNAHAQKHKRVTHEVKVGPLMIQWDQGVLFVRTPIESHLLNRAEAALLLSYLYDRRRSLLPQRE